MNKNLLLYPINRLVTTAKLILTEKQRLLEGAGSLYNQCCSLGLPYHDNYLQALNSIQSDCDELPLQPQFRKHCSAKYLEESAIKIQQLEDSCRAEILQTCQHFVHEYQPFVKSESRVLSGLNEIFVMRLSLEAIIILCHALTEMGDDRYINSNHLLVALAVRRGSASDIFESRNINPENIRQELAQLLNDEMQHMDTTFSDRAFDILELAEREVETVQLVNSKHLLTAFFREGHTSAVSVLRKMGLELP